MLRNSLQEIFGISKCQFLKLGKQSKEGWVGDGRPLSKQGESRRRVSECVLENKGKNEDAGKDGKKERQRIFFYFISFSLQSQK